MPTCENFLDETSGKAETFAALLARAHAPERITEEYLVALQNLTISNPLGKAVQFRIEQNWLRNALPGAIGVTYLPPAWPGFAAKRIGIAGVCGDEAP